MKVTQKQGPQPPPPVKFVIELTEDETRSLVHLTGGCYKASEVYCDRPEAVAEFRKNIHRALREEGARG